MAKKEKKQEEPIDMSSLFQEVLDILEGKGVEPVRPGEEVDMDALIAQMETSLKHIETQAEEIYAKTGMTKEEVDEFAQNPDNFSKDEWDVLTLIREKVDTFQEEAERVAEEGIPMLKEEGPGKKKGKKGAKKRVKKKDWLPT